MAEVLIDVPGALWTRQMIDRSRVQEIPSELVRVVVAIDPMSGGSRERAELTDDEVGETGIVVVGLAANGHAYVLSHDALREPNRSSHHGARVQRSRGKGGSDFNRRDR